MREPTWLRWRRWTRKTVCACVCVCTGFLHGILRLGRRNTTTIVMKKSDANRLRYTYISIYVYIYDYYTATTPLLLPTVGFSVIIYIYNVSSPARPIATYVYIYIYTVSIEFRSAQSLSFDPHGNPCRIYTSRPPLFVDKILCIICCFERAALSVGADCLFIWIGNWNKIWWFFFFFNSHNYSLKWLFTSNECFNRPQTIQPSFILLFLRFIIIFYGYIVD